MAITPRITKLSNPRSNSTRRRIRPVSGSRPRRKTSNPGLLVTLGNPVSVRKYKAARKLKSTKSKTKRKKSIMAKTRRKHTARRRTVTARRPRRRTRVARRRVIVVHKRAVRRRRRSNPAPVVVVKRSRVRRRKPVHARRRTRYARSHRNPSMSKDLFTQGIAIVGGVAATRALPSLVSRFITLPSGSPWINVGITGVAAFVVGMLAEKVQALRPYAGAITGGGIAETVSQALNAVGFTSLGTYKLTLNGMPTGNLGYFADANFVVPQNPLRLPAPMAITPARAAGVSGAFPGAFGGR